MTSKTWTYDYTKLSNTATSNTSNTYDELSIDARMAAYSIPSDPKDVLDDGLVFLPVGMEVVCNGESHPIDALLRRVPGIRFIRYGALLAVPPEVASAVSLFVLNGSDYAGLGIVEFLVKTLTGNDKKEM